MPIRSLSAGNLYGMVGKKYSFKAVSIDPESQKGQTSGYKQPDGLLIADGKEKIDKLTQNGADEKVASTINRYHQLDDSMQEKKRIARSKPWWYPTSNAMMNLRKKELGQKNKAIQEQESAIEEYKNRLQEIKKITRDVKMQINESAANNEMTRVKAQRPLEDYKGGFTKIDGFKKIAGYETEKGVLNKYFISEIKKEQNGEPADVPGSVLFFGPTGNGKTIFAKAFAKETGCNLVPIRARVTGVDTNGEESERLFMEDLMRNAQKSEERFQKTRKRTIIFVDEITKVADKNSSILPELKNFLVDCSDRYHCTVFCASNHPLNIGLPMESGNRIFPFVVSMDPPNKENKAAVMAYYLKERMDKNTDYDELADYMSKTEEQKRGIYNISQIKDEICLEGSSKALSVEEVKENIDKATPNVTMQDLAKYSKEMDELIKNEVDY